MGRSCWWRARSLAPLAILTLLLACAVLSPQAVSAATFAQARTQLRSWHLKPRPLFPSHLPAAHRNVNVHLYGFQGVDYVVDFGAGNTQDCHTIPNPNGWCVQLRRWNGPATPPHGRAYGIRRIRIGRRHVVFFGDGGDAGGWWMTWRERGRAYAVWASMDKPAPALKRLTPFVKTLHPLA